jgi:hypothetical protein
VAPAKKTRIAAHERAPGKKNSNLIDGNDDAALFFDESKVPVEVIAVANDEAAGLDPADFEVIGEKEVGLERSQHAPGHAAERVAADVQAHPSNDTAGAPGGERQRQAALRRAQEKSCASSGSSGCTQ